MKRLGLLALVCACQFATAQSLVSAYEFNDTLAASFAANAHVGALDHRMGGSGGSSSQSTFYSTELVGATSKRVADVPNTHFFRAPHGIGANGGGAYVNQYSILIDMKVDPSDPAWCSLFNTTAENGNDGDSFLRWDGNSYSIGSVGVYGGAVSANQWYRIIVTVDAGSVGGHTLLNYYVDGAPVNSIDTTSSGLDGRWSLYCWNDGDPASDSVDIFGDNDGDNLIGKVSAIGFFDGVLSAQQAANWGRPGSPVPEPATLAVLALGVLTMCRRRKQ